MPRLILLIISLVTATVALGKTGSKGTVKDSSDTPIPGAMVLIHWDSAGSAVSLTENIGIRADLTIRTTDDGSFSVDLLPGFYDVFASASAFTPTCRKIRIKPGKPMDIVLHMNADPLYTAEMGTGPQVSVRSLDVRTSPRTLL